MRAALAAVLLSTTLVTSAGAATVPSSYSGTVFTTGTTGNSLFLGGFSARPKVPADLSQGWAVLFTAFFSGIGGTLTAELQGDSTDARAMGGELRVAAKLTGVIHNTLSLIGAGSPAAFNGTIDVALDGTWACSGDCRVPVYNYGQGTWGFSSAALSNGTYGLSAGPGFSGEGGGSDTPPATVPLPATAPLLALGLAGIAALRRRRKAA